MTLTVLRAWGLQRTEDFGELVFNLIEAGTFGKTEQDDRQDFAHGYDFAETFSRPFEVAPGIAHRKPRSRRRQI